MTTQPAGYLIPSEESSRISDFLKAQNLLMKSGVHDEKILIGNLNAFLDTLKTYTTEQPHPEGYYIHYKRNDKRSQEFPKTYASYEDAVTALRNVFPSHSDNRWKNMYEIRPVSGEQAYQDFLNKPIIDHQPILPDFKPTPHYEIRYISTNKRSVSFPDQYVSRPEALRARYDAWRTTADGYVTIGEWVNSYPIHEVAQ